MRRVRWWAGFAVLIGASDGIGYGPRKINPTKSGSNDIKDLPGFVAYYALNAEQRHVYGVQICGEKVSGEACRDGPGTRWSVLWCATNPWLARAFSLDSLRVVATGGLHARGRILW